MACELVSWALTTVAEAKELAGIPAADVSYDDLICRLINSTSSFIEKATDRKLAARDYSKDDLNDREDSWLNGDNTTKLHLKQYPVNSVSYIEVNSSEISEAAITDYYASAGYMIFNRQGMLYYESGWSMGIQNVRASYNAGYAEGTPEREELRELCNALVALVFKTKDSLGLKSERIGNYSYTKANLKDIQVLFGVDGLFIINRYRRKWGGK